MAPRGRPRRFDRDDALERAMQVFWAKGYDATQVSDLMVAMSINPPSFYAAFQSKEAIFREAIELYLSTVGGRSMAALSQTTDVRTAVEAMLMAAVEVALASGSAGGCLVSLGLVNCQPQHADLRDHLRGLRRTTVGMIRDRLEAGRSGGELGLELDLDQLARFFAAVLNGLSLQAQDGASRSEMSSVVASALTVIPPLVRKGVGG